jgi:hypothetical protein
MNFSPQRACVNGPNIMYSSSWSPVSFPRWDYPGIPIDIKTTMSGCRQQDGRLPARGAHRCGSTAVPAIISPIVSARGAPRIRSRADAVGAARTSANQARPSCARRYGVGIARQLGQDARHVAREKKIGAAKRRMSPVKAVEARAAFAHDRGAWKQSNGQVGWKRHCTRRGRPARPDLLECSSVLPWQVSAMQS